MVVLDWILVALVGGFVAATAGLSFFDGRRAGPAGTAEARLWSVAEAAWVGSHRRRGVRVVTTLTMPRPLVVTTSDTIAVATSPLRFVRCASEEP